MCSFSVTMKVGTRVVIAGMNSDIPSSAVIALELRKRSLARTNPPEMHKAHCRVTVTTVKITEFRTDRPFM